jgi:hypothetical protein
MRRPLLLPLAFLTLALLACNTLFPPRPAITWDTDPTALIVRDDTCCGMMYDPNGLPTLQLWGDGRMLWVTFDSNNVRHVYTATLTTAQMTALLQKFVDAGFFGFKDSYEPPYQVYDAPNTCLSVTLSTLGKTVCDLMGNAPAKFYDLEADLTNGVTPTEYIPTTGFLTASQINGVPSGVNFQWPAEALGLSLKDAGSGVWVEGKTLEVAWRAVNAAPFNAIVQEGDAYYSLTVLLPDLTRQQPPTPTP